MENTLSPNALLVVKLEAQQWNGVLAGIGELKLKDGLPLWKAVMDQLQGQAPMSNGLDTHSMPSGDPLPV